MKADKEEEQYILMTYRSNIEKKMPTTYYNSDSGWGCMLRVGQMAIANLIHLHEKIPLKILLTLFWDNSDMPFSIQNFTFVTSKEYPNKKPYEWYNPCEMGFIVKKLLEEQFPIYQTKIFLDNSIFLSEIPKDKPKLLLMIMIRIGLEQPEDIYLPVVKSLIQNPFFFAAMGGTPKHAHLFLKVKDNLIGYLDPHKTNKAAVNQTQLLAKQQQYISNLSWIKLTKIDSSMALIYNLKREEVEQFWTSLQQIKNKFKEHCFLYMERERPQYDEADLIEISDDFP